MASWRLKGPNQRFAKRDDMHPSIMLHFGAALWVTCDLNEAHLKSVQRDDPCDGGDISQSEREVHQPLPRAGQAVRAPQQRRIQHKSTYRHKAFLSASRVLSNSKIKTLRSPESSGQGPNLRPAPLNPKP